MTAHKHAHLMEQYAQDALETDKPWERWEWKGGRGWYPLASEFAFSIHYEYRRKPRTLTYTVTIPEPLREAPKNGSEYYVPCQLAPALWGSFEWYNGDLDKLYLKRGLCFATREDAIAAAKAMLLIKGEEA